MLNRSIVVCGVCIGLLFAGLVALADHAVRQQLQQATGELALLPATAVMHTTGAIR